ncbi:MAG TPA: four helix bundle protein [Lacunisphaera sp.]
MRNYAKIEAWRLADDLTVAIYEKTKMFPREELYGLVSQIRRAAYSVPANIVEGSSRESKRDYLHFLHIARGSLSESQYFIHLANRLGYLSEADKSSLQAKSRQAFACLQGLITAVGEEAGVLDRITATATSMIALLLVRLIPIAGLQ